MNIWKARYQISEGSEVKIVASTPNNRIGIFEILFNSYHKTKPTSWLPAI